MKSLVKLAGAIGLVSASLLLAGCGRSDEEVAEDMAEIRAASEAAEAERAAAAEAEAEAGAAAEGAAAEAPAAEAAPAE